MQFCKWLLLTLLAAACGPVHAVTSPMLGDAKSFAVLGASKVSNTGPTILLGDIGITPGSSITGLASVTLIGAVHQVDAAAQLAHAASLNAFEVLSGQLNPMDLSGQDLGGRTLHPGVYNFSSSAQLTGLLTLDSQNTPNALYVFQIGSTLTTASASEVSVVNGGANDGIYWLVGTSATLGTSTRFAGNILADKSITLTTDAMILGGRAIALNAAVTMDTNTVVSNCAIFDCGGKTDFGSAGFSGGFGNGQAVPLPSPIPLLAAGLLALISRKSSRSAPGSPIR